MSKFEAKQDFCKAFFHIRSCYEWNQPEMCLCKNEPTAKPFCTQQASFAAVRVTWKQHVLHRALIKGSEKHAENILIRDKSLQLALKDNCVVTICLTCNPCHLYDGLQSCVNDLLQWYQSTLKPRQIKLELVCANLFRVHWTKADMRNGILQQRAAEGLCTLFAEKEIIVRGMTWTDWESLIRYHSSKELLRELPKKWQPRLDCDERVDTFLSNARKQFTSNQKTLVK
jgi:hypothetical protein